MKNKKYLSLVAAKAQKLIVMDESNNEGDDELVMLAKNFKKLLKYNNKGKNPKKFNSKIFDNYEKRKRTKEYWRYKKDQPKCFKCNKPDHIKGDCPRLKKKSQPKKAMKAT
ncbi:hypothetical protein LIER_13290 [Lithospermum erythrorhizon]|uniref:CCHC-type domain-containing protein n=1 Tax=Lithospermum erythrorhizon TaxID=34254 RepID=A0AAV3PWH2_LITER